MPARRKAARPTKKAAMTRKKYRLQEARVMVDSRGRGKPILWLHSEDTYERDLAIVDELAKKYRVVMPWMPGFGQSTLPESVTSIDDISYLYLDLMDELNLRNAVVVGFSVGGWLAAEMATKNTSRIRKLMLVAPLGAKFGGKYDRDIEDIYYNTFDKVKAMKFHDVERDPRVLTEMSDRRAMFIARHRETTARLCWKPYFHNPSLKYRLNRIDVPTTIVWGAKDGLVRPAYGRKFAKRIAGAKFVSIPRAGHFPHVERPEEFNAALRAFLR